MSDTVTELLAAIYCPFDECNIIKCGKNWIEPSTKLSSIMTSHECPLKVEVYALWVQKEWVKVFCDPSRHVCNILIYLRECTIESTGFVNGEEVDLASCAGTLSTSEAKPLVIKKLIVTDFQPHM